MTIRQKGIVKLVVGSIIFSVILYWVYRTGDQNSHHFYELTLMALPGAYALVGLIESITGISFFRFAEAWNQLKGWQRGVFGTAFLLVFSVALFFILYFIIR